VTRRCEFCGVEFPITPMVAFGRPVRRGRARKFCTDLCAGRARKQRAMELLAGDVAKQCAYCMAEFTQARGEYPRKYCTANCRTKAFRIGGLGDIPTEKIERLLAYWERKQKYQRRLAQASQ
jgi:Fe-S-cluster-containing dehydrogenase component